MQCSFQVRIHGDNSTTVHCIKRRGSVRSPTLNGWILSLNLLLRKKGVLLSTFHIAGVRNVIADALSRVKAMNSEYSLDRISFSWICNLGPPPKIDLFSTRENHQLPQYCSPILDPQAVKMDAFLED